MAGPSVIAETYLATWSEDGATRPTLLSRSWSPDARYLDPMMAGEGREGIASMIESARAQFPGHAFKLRGAPGGHGRLSWTLAPAGEVPVAHGTDVVRIDEGMTKPLFDRAREKGTDDKIGQLNALRRAGRRDEIAKVALFLAPDDASCINGQVLPVDGGLSSSRLIVPPKRG